MTPSRIDAALVARGLARSRGDAQELIRSGAVQLNETAVRKMSTPVRETDQIVVRREGPLPVGRGAYKLEKAFELFGRTREDPFDVGGQRCLDIGASTGGFTQVLLAHGAREVTALDVGHGQLSPTLRSDPRVREESGRNIRETCAIDIDGPFPIIVGDLSFVSLALVMPAVAELIDDPGQAVLLVKPQFESGRNALDKNGVVRDPREHRRAICAVARSAREQGLFPREIRTTGLPGRTGNHEYLMWITTREELALTDDEAAADTAVDLPGRTR
ncbi:TlyA family RNA methyltransferase [Austwickia chelonae]|uniref:TlyA family RNA methyltransferase n=1 Tax=Austwickia chelonae TaxID=100225 RepID=UPI000E27AC98|nr:TlyA family RNA methyltransferase [Austwickia chelonae]